MPGGIPRNARHFDSSVLPILHQSGLCLSQPFCNATHVSWAKRDSSGRTPCGLQGWFWDDRLRDTGKAAGILVPSLNSGVALLALVPSPTPGCYVVMRFGVHRGKALGLVPKTVVPLCPMLCCLHHGPWFCAVWGPPRENPGHRPNDRFPHVPVFAHHPDSCIFWFGQQQGLPGCGALLGPVLLRKHQGATSRYVNGWFWDDQLR